VNGHLHIRSLIRLMVVAQPKLVAKEIVVITVLKLVVLVSEVYKEFVAHLH